MVGPFPSPLLRLCLQPDSLTSTLNSCSMTDWVLMDVRNDRKHLNSRVRWY